MKENMNPEPGSTRGSAEASDTRFREVLRAARPSPLLPPRFQENVWRRIEEADATAPSGSWLDAFAALVLRPRFAYATVAGQSNEANPVVACAKNMNGSPKVVAECTSHTTMPACKTAAVASAK